jgi:hypothetical protein
MVLVEGHEGKAGGYYAGKTTMEKLLCPGFWWPVVHKYMPKNISINVMSVRGLENPIGGMICP